MEWILLTTKLIIWVAGMIILGTFLLGMIGGADEHKTRKP
jgi:hypothetical protein